MLENVPPDVAVTPDAMSASLDADAAETGRDPGVDADADVVAAAAAATALA